MRNRPTALIETLTILAISCGALSVSTPVLAGSTVADVQVRGTSLQVELSDGEVLEGPALTGIVLTIADNQNREREIRIDGAERDTEDSLGKRWLYHLMVRDVAGGGWSHLCEPGPKGLRLGFPVSGIGTDDGSFRLSKNRLSFTCTSGAVAKCIRMGYEPWATTEKGEPLLDPLRACIRMVRADYCGDGRPHTRDGTLINVYDRLGIQTSDPSSDLVFEAAWGPEGAVCVHKTRLDEVWTLDQLDARCGKRLAGNLGSDCSKAKAMSLPEALIFNDSR